ncbi:MAG: 2,3-bisphosphoglycerate-independent phosphoglycerate mutase [Methylicorpusculum sp.]|uniref:2,3-bisphosphoglycerate-independent phosphoglycerate mutase n=1 Tax=Methylicorpusculum sp. TaxID=2713644 RepID=UPI0027218CE2|nr:2,3-bisphosphoglycerate-independent phosphoglycerate mutase [Methylicorpusculum sp.]MDO8845501.1 2,3-bisphosphoglycerate-independent phosphoglycerate mutase [Methylicorpusculum sp.]MDO8938665.1 2,3-bisphosphoglycerate-independent phosphoglycerate mutase [Methylicorpusculum sp.]MDP2200452.1 2,3-bisphosphoglycerate-independent phosphoglycerate mutase [Methylicorpusculum sp.]
MKIRPKPLLLLILDGFGYRQETDNNAIALANTPCWDSLIEEYPMTLINCSGRVVGLPADQMGNSEVGHLHIGSGRYVPQDLSRVNDAIEDGSFFENPALCGAVDQAIAKNKALHVMGLLSPGGVHSHELQIIAMLELAAKRGLRNIYLHAILDGRDVPPQSAMDSLKLIEEKFNELGVGRIASIVGRFYAMDRDKRWERVKEACDLIVNAKASHQAVTAKEALQAAYDRGETDEFVLPTVIVDQHQQGVPLDQEDSIVFMNFRADRAREISQAITDEDFNGFERDFLPHKGSYVTLTEYHEKFNYPVAYPSLEVKNGLGETLSKSGLTQLRLAETEKYAHVTFFLNGGTDEPFPGEDRILVPSPKVRTYDLQPEMSAEEVTDQLVEAILGQKYDVIICNYANCDMVGHTGILDAAIIAVETIDKSLQRIVEALKSAGGQMLVTADHGNIEQMSDEQSGQPHTAHTTNLVPLVYVLGDKPLVEGGGLSDLAPTMLEILGVPQPLEMTGRSLLGAK